MDFTKVAENLTKHGFKVSCFETGAEAADYLCSQLKGKVIGMGGTQTGKELNLYERLSENNTFYCHSYVPEEDTFRGAMNAEVYISSINGLAETGEIINIDGTGNRVAATLFGPKTVYYIVGRNKLAPDFEKAMWRARNIASPLNAKRLGRKTPCAMSAEMKCYDCNSPERICRGFVVTTHPMKGTELMEVILINEDLGY